MSIQIVKKDKSLQNFNPKKIVDAISKSADRACVKLTQEQEKAVVDYVCKFLIEHGQEEIEVNKLHHIVENALDEVDPKVAKCYRDYRNYKTNFFAMLDAVYRKKLSLNFIADRSNANADSALVTTQKAITYNELNTEFYKRFFLNEEERKASDEGFIYIHDKNARLDTMNCFERATRFITSEGVKSFYDYKEGDELLVLSHTGKWRKAKVIKLPWSKLQTVTFTRGKTEFKVNCTPNHRWILKDGSITTDLKVGDKLVSTPNVFNWDEDSLADHKQLKLWCLGFAFADGYVPKGATGLTSMGIRLCGDKIKYADLFRKCGYTVKPKKNTTDLTVYMPDAHSKVLPYDMNHTNITSFMRGYISADGDKLKGLSNGRDNEYRGVYTSGSFNDWMYDFLNISGCYVTKVVDYSGKETNYGTRKERSFGYSFYNSTSTKTWHVKSIDSYKLNPKANVWCLDVEEDHSFILEGGIPTGNCCIYNMEGLLKGGFKMGNLEYNEPKTLDVAFDLLCDVTMNAASAQYGGFTIPEIDKLLGYYAEKSYKKYLDEFNNICDSLGHPIDTDAADKYAYEKVKRDVDQGVQGMEMKFNSVASSRGDYPFTAVTFGLGRNRLETLISSTFLKVRKEGQGKEGFKRPVLFPKLSFFYDESLHGEGKELEWLFDEAIDCSSKTMYPDFISLEGEDSYAAEMYKKYKTPISRMGCLSSDTTISLIIKGVHYDNISFKEAWELLSGSYEVKNQALLGFDSGKFIDLSNVKIKDIGEFVDCSRIIMNEPSTDWYNVSVSYELNNVNVSCTHDHIWTTNINEFKQTIDLEIGDSVLCLTDDNEVKIGTINNITHMPDTCKESYDVTTETEHFMCNKAVRSHNCRATLAPYYLKGFMEPADETDRPTFVGRFNMGAIALNFPMIAAKAKEEGKDFYEVLDYYLELVRGLSQKTVEFLSHKKAGINPLGFCEGGFIGGNKDPEEELGREFLKPMTISFGIIALNEASVFVTGKSIAEDNTFAIEVMKHINCYVNRIKKEDQTLYAIYGVPGETAVGTLRDCFVKKYGVIKGVSDKPYFTNSFHCAVYEDINPIQKQDQEHDCYHMCNGGNIQYCRYKLGYNKEAIKTLVKRAMHLGYYEGVNLELNYCLHCGHQYIDGDKCPKCNSDNVIQVQRMNGYLGYSKLGKDKTYFNEVKMQEFRDRVSM